MNPQILVDTGPIVAFLDRRDTHHAWAVAQFRAHPPPFLTCEAVLTEASHILARNGFHSEIVFELITPGAVAIGFDLQQEHPAVQALMNQYQDRPMDFADACLVRMSERFPDSQVLTLDSDFTIYRRNRREPIPVLMP